MKDGHLGKCKTCSIYDSSSKNGLYFGNCPVCGSLFRRQSTYKKFCSMNCRNKSFRENPPVKGKHWKLSDKAKINIGNGQRGEKSHFWKGGITSKSHIIRNNVKFDLWRKRVFKRDNYTCQKCKARSGIKSEVYIHAHHIENFAERPKLRTALKNGITLCREDHKLFHKLYGFRKNNKKQLLNFLK